MFQSLPKQPEDKILGLMAKFRDDPRAGHAAERLRDLGLAGGGELADRVARLGPAGRGLGLQLIERRALALVSQVAGAIDRVGDVAIARIVVDRLGAGVVDRVAADLGE